MQVDAALPEDAHDPSAGHRDQVGVLAAGERRDRRRARGGLVLVAVVAAADWKLRGAIVITGLHIPPAQEAVAGAGDHLVALGREAECRQPGRRRACQLVSLAEVGRRPAAEQPDAGVSGHRHHAAVRHLDVLHWPVAGE